MKKYCPISITSFTKIFVKLSFFLRFDNPNVLIKFKHGFSKDRSTETPMVKCTQILNVHMDIGEHVDFAL